MAKTQIIEKEMYKNIGLDFTHKCKCGRNDHIHLLRHRDTAEAIYYCGECGMYYPIREAVEVKT